MDGERASGSGRSIPGVSLHGILKELSARFTDFGGHDQAVGGTLPAAGFEAFCTEARALFRDRVPPEALAPRAEADVELPLDAVNEELLRELARLEPHGAGNAKPVFLARGAGAFAAFSPVGSSGLRGRLRTPRGGIRAIAWQPAADLSDLLASGRPLDVQYRLEDDRRGYGLQAEIVRARATETAP
jgi:single-stranded-DNA-specific exonuclease